MRTTTFTTLIPILALAGVLIAGGCSKHAPSGASAPASATAPAASASSAALASPAAAASAEPTATPDPNLLSWRNGTLVRSYPAALDSPSPSSPSSFASDGFTLPTGATGPYAFVFELPGNATFTSFAVDLPATATGQSAGSVDVGIASDAAAGPYRDLGTVSTGPADVTKTLTVSAGGRWVRVTANGTAFGGVRALGTLAAPPAAMAPAGIYVESSSPYANGTFLGHAKDSDPWYRRVVVAGNAMTGTRCFNGHYGAAYPGTLDGRTWTFQDGSTSYRAIVNDDASAIVGEDEGPIYLLRSTLRPTYCEPFDSGTGARHVLVLDNNVAGLWPIEDNAIPGYSYERIAAGMLDAAALAGKDLVIFNMLCNADTYFSSGQTDALLQWIRAGHKLLIVDSDECGKTAYGFLPYPFTTSNPGAHGASSDRLILVESDALGTSDRSDAAHYFDPQAYVTDGVKGQVSNQLGDANVVTTQDAHWCGHLFGTNANNQNGFMQMYATYGQGLIIYDGFDRDDGSNVGYQRVRSLEFALPIPASLPCTQSVAGGFVVQPNQEATFVAGKARTMTFSMEALANLGWKGHLAMRVGGDFPATVSPAGFDMAGGTQPLRIAVSIPASAKAGVYTVTATGDDGSGHAEQASITFTGTAPLRRAIRRHERIRIYGIHFDVDSAHIQSKSEAVIRQIADLMKANPSVRFQVEGHTDSDGGAAYNLGLSQRRAQAVVDDLVHRYGIARSRLVPKGFGLTEPVKPNTSAANKALNRRVELLAL